MVVVLGVVVFLMLQHGGGDAAPGPQHSACLVPCHTHAGLRLRGGGAAWEEEEDDLLGGFVPSLTTREVVCIASVCARGRMCSCVCFMRCLCMCVRV
jgi:hypothetical protein